MLLSLSCWAAFDRAIGAGKLLLLLGDLGDGVGVEVGSHSDGCLMKPDCSSGSDMLDSACESE